MAELFAGIDELRRRSSIKWAAHPPDVLPAFIAESDVQLAPCVREALERALADSDTGYAIGTGLPETMAAWARRRFDWQVDPGSVVVLPDVVAALTQTLLHLTAPDAQVVISTPVYHPFAPTIEHAGRRVVDVPLIDHGDRHQLDAAGLDAAFAAGASVWLLCSPHNPTGTVHDRATLEAAAAAAARHGVLVISDEAWAPMTLPGATHIPFPLVAGGARHVTLTSPSKTFNLAGLKCAVAVAGDDELRRRFDAVDLEVFGQVGHFGVIASIAAWQQGDAWTATLIDALAGNRTQFAQLLAANVPGARHVPAAAGYLAWVDLSSAGGGDDPAVLLLERGRLAVEPGVRFGPQGIGKVRINLGTSPALIGEIVSRIAAALA